jgi:hypothetical protein
MKTLDRIGFAPAHPVRAAIVGVTAGSVAGGCVDLTQRRLSARGWLVGARGRELCLTPLGVREMDERLRITAVHA